MSLLIFFCCHNNRILWQVATLCRTYTEELWMPLVAYGNTVCVHECNRFCILAPKRLSLPVADPGGGGRGDHPPPPWTCPDTENLCKVCVTGTDQFFGGRMTSRGQYPRGGGGGCFTSPSGNPVSAPAYHSFPYISWAKNYDQRIPPMGLVSFHEES